MTMMDAIRESDRLRPNSFPAEDKLRWLDRLDRRLREEIHAQHEGTAPSLPAFSPEDLTRELLVGAPYDELYIHWLCAQMDYYNGELDSFNAANTMFEAVFRQFRNAYHRAHLPLGTEKRCF